MATILVVDDDSIVSLTIDRILKKHGFQTVLAQSGVEALKIARRHPPELAILDVLMPGMNGFEVCQEMRRDPILERIPILFLTAKGDDQDIIEGFTSGGDDYLIKPFNIHELILRVKAILRRTHSGTPSASKKSYLLQVGQAKLDSRTGTVVLPHGSFSLTPVQYDLLYHLMVHADEVFSAQQLLNDVWNYPFDTGSPDLVRVHIRNLRQRIEQDPNEPTYIQTVPGHGYTFSTTHESV